MKAAELRELLDDELLVRLEQQKDELFNLRFQAATGQLDNPMRIKQVRHDIARILTVLRGRQTESDMEVAIAQADREALEERRDAMARGELQGRSLGDVEPGALSEEEAEQGAMATEEEPEEGEA